MRRPPRAVRLALATGGVLAVVFAISGIVPNVSG
jgi:hypothetical protein